MYRVEGAALCPVHAGQRSSSSGTPGSTASTTSSSTPGRTTGTKPAQHPTKGNRHDQPLWLRRGHTAHRDEILITRLRRPVVLGVGGAHTPRHVLRWWGPNRAHWCRATSTSGSAGRGATSRGWTTAPSSDGTARTARSSTAPHRDHRGVRGVPRRRVGQHDDSTHRRRHDARDARASRRRVPRRPRRVGHGAGMQDTFDRLDDCSTGRRPPNASGGRRPLHRASRGSCPTRGRTRRRATAGSPATSSATWSSGCRASSQARGRAGADPSVDDDPVGGVAALSDHCRRCSTTPIAAARDHHRPAGHHTARELRSACSSSATSRPHVGSRPGHRARRDARRGEVAGCCTARTDGRDAALSGHYGPRCRSPTARTTRPN